MNEQRIEEIKNAIRELIQNIVARGEPLSDDMKLNVAQVMQHAANRIQQLRQEEQAQLPPEQVPEEPTPANEGLTPTSPTSEGQHPTNEPIPTLEQAPYQSSNISKFRYEPETQKLYVQFLGKHPDPNGPVYSYEGVPKNIFQLFRRGSMSPKTSGRNAWHTWREGITPSHGASMYALIRDSYPYQRIS